MRESGRVWEHLGEPEKLGEPGRTREHQENLGESGRVWENLGESGRVWEHRGEPEKLGVSGRIWENLGESGRIWENLGESARASSLCALRARNSVGKSWGRAGKELEAVEGEGV